MHTLSLFPALFTFEIFAPMLLRLVISLYLLSLGLSRYKKEYKWSSLLYFVVSGLLFVGLYTQAAAIVGLFINKFDFYVDYWKSRKTIPVGKEKYLTYALVVVILLSLLLTGPGAFAFDLPL